MRLRENLLMSVQEANDVSERRDAFIQRHAFCQLQNRYNESLSAEIQEGLVKRQIVVQKVVIFKFRQNVEFRQIDRRVELTVGHIVKDAAIDTTDFSRIIDHNFEKIWSSS